MKAMLMCLALVASSLAGATPVPFATARYDVSASAEAGSQLDGPTDASGEAGALPLIVNADALDGFDLASASAIADDGVLGTTAEAAADDLFASALGTANLFATIDEAGRYRLRIDFDSFSDSIDGFAAGTLLIGLNVDGVDLVDTALTGSQRWVRDFSLVDNALLDLTLISEAEALAGAYGFNLASAEFALLRIAEPDPLALLALLLPLLGAMRRRRCDQATVGRAWCG